MSSPTTAADMVARELAKKSELHYEEDFRLFRGKFWQGGVWKLGCIELTMVNGELTDVGRIYQTQFPSVSLSHAGRRCCVSDYELLHLKESELSQYES